MSFHCPRCNAPLVSGATFCHSCGARLDDVDQQSAYGAAHGASRGGTDPHGLTSDVRGWAIGAHLAGLGAALLSVATLGFLGPLAIWLIKRDQHPYVEHHAKEALNFQLTVLAVLLASAVLAIPAAIVGVLTLGIGLVLLGILAGAAVIAWFVLPIIGAVKASAGEGYRYPFTVRFVR